MNTEFTQLQERLERLENDNTTLQARVIACEHTAQRERRRWRIQAGLAFAGLLGAVFVFPANRAAVAQGYGVTLATLNTRLIAVEARTQFQSADTTAKATTFSGCNVIVNDGGGSTDTAVHNAAGDGLGNLILGYNDMRAESANNRTGCHNLVLGVGNNYSSYAGLVTGYFNTVSGSYAATLCGTGNLASGDGSSVTGGENSTAHGRSSAISGGNTITNNFIDGWSGGSLHSP
ncbi:MAG: hypothetical protein JWN14_4607 [Chthonomonadales bacterium]|nr:hypothetical protein [Chthonomonadales bacterium]